MLKAENWRGFPTAAKVVLYQILPRLSK